jgi:hypothetical protein
MAAGLAGSAGGGDGRINPARVLPESLDESPAACVLCVIIAGHGGPEGSRALGPAGKRAENGEAGG